MRTIDQRSELRHVAGGQRIRRVRHDHERLLEELLEARDEMIRRELVVGTGPRRVEQHRWHLRDRAVGRRLEGLAQCASRRVRPRAAVEIPRIHQPVRRARRAIVALLGRTGFRRHDAAHADHERILRRPRHRAL